MLSEQHAINFLGCKLAILFLSAQGRASKGNGVSLSPLRHGWQSDGAKARVHLRPRAHAHCRWFCPFDKQSRRTHKKDNTHTQQRAKQVSACGLCVVACGCVLVTEMLCQGETNRLLADGGKVCQRYGRASLSLFSFFSFRYLGRKHSTVLVNNAKADGEPPLSSTQNHKNVCACAYARVRMRVCACVRVCVCVCCLRAKTNNTKSN